MGSVTRGENILVIAAAILAASVSLLVAVGIEAVPAVLIPPALAAMPLVSQRHPTRRRLALVSVILLAAFCFVAGFSVGYFYVPSTALILGSIILDERAQRAAATDQPRATT